MIKIVHLADVHIRNAERHNEYRRSFQRIYNEITNIQPDYIVIVGDLFENYEDRGRQFKEAVKNL